VVSVEQRNRASHDATTVALGTLLVFVPLPMSPRTCQRPAPRPALAAWLMLGVVGVARVAEAGVAAAPTSEAPAAPAQPVPARQPVPAQPGAAASAHEGSALAGKWHAEPMTVRWVIGSWSEACGPRPSGGGDQGGPVTIEEHGGELVIAGQGGSFSSEQCWQMHPGLSRQSHAATGATWKTTCRSAPSDARQEILQTTVSLVGETLSLQESGQYQFVVQGQTCAASSGRWRTYRREPAAPPPFEAPTAPAPAARNPCATPGSPARIEVRPSRKLMRAGESFHFRSSVFDAQGCSLGTPVAWSVSPASASASIDGGRLTVAEGAADAELSITATAASQSVGVQVEVVSDERYAALLASGNFNAEGASSEAATATITAGSLGARQGVSQPGPSDRKWTFVGLVSAIALVFALIGVWLLRRASRGGAMAVSRGRPLPDTGTVVFADEDTIGEPLRRLDATRLEAAPPPPALKPASVCPVCGTMYDKRAARVCPKDGAQLLPINA
jgi:hypothetical protein